MFQQQNFVSYLNYCMMQLIKINKGLGGCIFNIQPIRQQIHNARQNFDNDKHAIYHILLC